MAAHFESRCPRPLSHHDYGDSNNSWSDYTVSTALTSSEAPDCQLISSGSQHEREPRMLDTGNAKPLRHRGGSAARITWAASARFARAWPWPWAGSILPCLYTTPPTV